jgi:hypothetical protein
LAAVLKFAYIEEWDSDFIRWSGNLLRAFLSSGRLERAVPGEKPDLLLTSIWRKHDLPADISTILISSENWDVFPAHEKLTRHLAVLGICPPRENRNFIGFPYAAVHYDTPIEQLYGLRDELLAVPKTRICCFVVSNMMGDLARGRLQIFKYVSRWRPVDSAGKVMNNTGYLAPRGLDFLRWIAQYKYMICLENSLAEGYFTEKPFQAWLAGTVPIYDGGALSQLNPEAIVPVSAQMLQTLDKLEQNPALYANKRLLPLTQTSISLDDFERRFASLLDGL